MYTIEQVDAAFKEHRRATEELRSLYDSAGERDLTGEEKQTEQRLHEAIDGNLERAQAGTKWLMDEKRADKSREQFEELRASHVDVEGRQESAEATQLRKLISGEVRAVEFEARDLLKGTATDGQELVPQSMYSRIHEYIESSSSVMLSGATAVRTASGEDITVPKTTSYSTAAIVAEAGSISESDPQFDTVTLGAYKYAFLVQVANELLQDSAFDVEAFLARRGGMALGRGMNAHFITGSGSGQPGGVDLATVGVTAASTTAITGDELINLQESVDDAYQQNGTWIMNQATRSLVRKLKDSNGQYLWQPAVTAGAPSTLLGSELRTDSAMATGAANAITVVYGDLSGYFTRFAGSVRIERSNDFAFANDLVTFRFIQRADGDIVDTVGIRTLKQAAS